MTFGKGRLQAKRKRTAPETTIKFDVTVRRQGQVTINAEEFPNGWTIEDILKSLFTSDHDYGGAEELKEIHHVGYPDPYVCTGDMSEEPTLGVTDGKCRRKVEYLVDDKHMCLPHMRAEIAKGTAPRIMPSASSGMVEMKPTDTVTYPSSVVVTEPEETDFLP